MASSSVFNYNVYKMNNIFLIGSDSNQIIGIKFPSKI